MLPQVPERGSVEASGDLVPLCYVASVLFGEGEVTHRGETRDAAEVLETEINASTDNPLFDAESGAVHSGGNFYAGHVVQAMDSLKVAVANVADLLDRQLELLVDEKFNNGLTANLIPYEVQNDERQAGLHHGFKGMQIAASALTGEALKTASSHDLDHLPVNH